MTVPGEARAWPSFTSSPARTMFCPGLAGLKMVTVSLVKRVDSYFTTASAPGGMGAPVSTFTAVPSVTAQWETPPAGISSSTRSSTGLSSPAPCTSWARKA